jgi:ABC-type amino acid transport substrate-binding protein
MDIMKKQSGVILAYVILIVLLASAECAAENKTLLFVGNDSYPPISYQEGGKPKGLAIDIVRALGQRMGRQIDIRLMEWKVAQAMVAKGKADALCQLSITEPRKKIYDFSDQAHDLRFSIFVRTGKQGIDDLSDLRGLQVAVITASVQYQYVMADSQIKYTLTANDLQGFQLLKDGQVDAVLADLWTGSYVLAQNGITGIQTSGEPFAHLASALAVKKGNTALLAAINDGLRSLQADGTIERINEKWRHQEIIVQTREQAVRKTYSYYRHPGLVTGGWGLLVDHLETDDLGT